MNHDDRKTTEHPATAAAAEIYRQARDQTATQTGYQLDRGLERLNRWIAQHRTGSSSTAQPAVPAEHASPAVSGQSVRQRQHDLALSAAGPKYRSAVASTDGSTRQAGDQASSQQPAAFAARLAGSWLDLADYVGIRPHEQDRFARGEEPHAIWDWLSDRGRLDDLHGALTAIGREDLARTLRSGQAGPDGAGLRQGTSLLAELNHNGGPPEDLTGEFIGRRGLLDRLTATFDDPRFPSGYVVIGGEPGIGKTALLATLARRGNLVCHYNSALAGVTSAEKFLRNVCARLILKYHLPYDRLPEDAAADGATLLRLLEEAARDQPVVVAVDAIDEAAPASTGNPLFLPSALPPGVIFVLTTRDLNDVELLLDNRRDLLIDGHSAQGRADAREYISAFLARDLVTMTSRLTQLSLDAAAFTEMLAERSEGNFLYLRHVLWSVREQKLGGDSATALTTLPSGLQAYYQHLEQQFSMHEHGGIAPERQLAILAVLAIWPRPLPARRLALFAGESLEATRTVLRWWSGFLTASTTGNEIRFALTHISFAGYVTGRQDMATVRTRMENAIERI